MAGRQQERRTKEVIGRQVVRCGWGRGHSGAAVRNRAPRVTGEVESAGATLPLTGITEDECECPMVVFGGRLSGVAENLLAPQTVGKRGGHGQGGGQ